jgi:type 1 glutamine amidotransferase/nicotinamidase-related amidase
MRPFASDTSSRIVFGHLPLAVTVGLFALGYLGGPPPAHSAESIDLSVRFRTETSADSGRFHAQQRSETWQLAETAVIVCDMWDLHHCLNATRRGTELAPRMDQVIGTLRKQGAVVIHAPSSCTKFYEAHPARKHAVDTPRAKQFPDEIAQWCRKIPNEEKGTYPIDQSDGGEDDDAKEHAQWAKELAAMGVNPKSPWTRQTAALTIKDSDYISDDGQEIWSILEQQGIKNVVLLGVHTNMCVLGRPFGLRNMARYGQNVVLMRDMTDTMYNPASKPFVSHFTGTDLIVEHIEKWVCPTITSDQVIGGKPFKFAGDRRPHVVIAMAEREYETSKSLPDWALSQLGKDYRVTLVHGNDSERNDLPGIEAALADADLLIVSVRRRALPTKQFEALQKYIESGKPVMGIRTANHAFSLRDAPTPEGCQVWKSFDADVFGGSYTGHHGAGTTTRVSTLMDTKSHPLLKGVDVAELIGRGSLYKVSPLAPDATPVLMGTIDNTPSEPIAWTNRTKFGGKAFYSSLGHVGDFEQPAVKTLFRNAVDYLLVESK